MENMFGDILSDLAGSLVGGMGMAPCVAIGDEHGLFQPAHGSAPDSMQQDRANPLAPTNFVVRGKQDRLWITLSTRVMPRVNDSRADACTGFIALAELGERDARIVADNLGYTNECVIDEDAGQVFVNETFGRRVTRFKLRDKGSLEQAHTRITFGAGNFPDGLALSVDGSLWVTSIVSNRVIVVQPNGSSKDILEDNNDAHLAATEAAYQTSFSRLRR